MKASEDSTLLHGTLAAPPRRGPPALVALIGLAVVAASVATFAARAATAPGAAARRGRGAARPGRRRRGAGRERDERLARARHRPAAARVGAQVPARAEHHGGHGREHDPRVRAAAAGAAQAGPRRRRVRRAGRLGLRHVQPDGERRGVDRLGLGAAHGGYLVDDARRRGRRRAPVRRDADDGPRGRPRRRRRRPLRQALALVARVLQRAQDARPAPRAARRQLRRRQRQRAGADVGLDDGRAAHARRLAHGPEQHGRVHEPRPAVRLGARLRAAPRAVPRPRQRRREDGGDDRPYNGSDDRIWRPDLSANEIYAVDAESGATVRQVGPFDWRTNDINHFQVLGDGTAIINGRVSGAFRKVELATGRTLWICGGHYGNFTIIDLNGTHWEPGWKSPHPKFLFDGQHNLEYFGNGEYLMFDNAYNEVNVSYIEASSRPMRLQLDEQNFVATITWAFETGVHSTVYGDADLLPTGHVLACYWPSQLSSTMENQFDARMVEVIPREAGAGRVRGRGRVGAARARPPLHRAAADGVLALAGLRADRVERLLRRALLPLADGALGHGPLRRRRRVVLGALPRRRQLDARGVEAARRRRVDRRRRHYDRSARAPRPTTHQTRRSRSSSSRSTRSRATSSNRARGGSSRSRRR